MGPFTPSRKRNMYLIVMVDGFSKYVQLKAVPTTKVEHVIKFLEDFIKRRIDCDRATTFTCHKFMSFTNDCGIKVIHNATATPRANGQAERYNRTILSAICASTENETQWDEWISNLQWGINSTINKSTGKIPNELLFGFLPTGKYGAYLSNEVLENTPTNLVFSRDQAKKSIDKMQEYQKRKFDQKRRICLYEGPVSIS